MHNMKHIETIQDAEIGQYHLKFKTRCKSLHEWKKSSCMATHKTGKFFTSSQ